jgi:hypothetical protein
LIKNLNAASIISTGFFLSLAVLLNALFWPIMERN